MTDTLITKEQSAVGGRTITNLRFANDINGLAGKETELASLVDRLDKTSAAFGIKVSTEKTKLMTSNTNGTFTSGLTVKNWTRLTVSSISGRAQSSKIKVPMSRIARTTAALGRLKTIWKDKNISLSSKVKLMTSYPGYLSTVVRLRNLDVYSGHSEEFAAGLAKTISQGTV